MATCGMRPNHFPEARRAFAESLAAALLFIVQAMPWLVIVVPVVWGVWKTLRRLATWHRARKKTT